MSRGQSDCLTWFDLGACTCSLSHTILFPTTYGQMTDVCLLPWVYLYRRAAVIWVSLFAISKELPQAIPFSNPYWTWVVHGRGRKRQENGGWRLFVGVSYFDFELRSKYALFGQTECVADNVQMTVAVSYREFGHQHTVRSLLQIHSVHIDILYL